MGHWDGLFFHQSGVSLVAVPDSDDHLLGRWRGGGSACDANRGEQLLGSGAPTMVATYTRLSPLGFNSTIDM